MRLYPRAEVDKKSSLAFYLKICGLGSKADMPYNRLWRIYSEAKENVSLSELHSSAHLSSYDDVQLLLMYRHIL